jgi:hypothetical protein
MGSAHCAATGTGKPRGRSSRGGAPAPAPESWRPIGAPMESGLDSQFPESMEFRSGTGLAARKRT